LYFQTIFIFSTITLNKQQEKLCDFPIFKFTFIKVILTVFRADDLKSKNAMLMYYLNTNDNKHQLTV